MHCAGSLLYTVFEVQAWLFLVVRISFLLLQKGKAASVDCIRCWNVALCWSDGGKHMITAADSFVIVSDWWPAVFQHHFSVRWTEYRATVGVRSIQQCPCWSVMCREPDTNQPSEISSHLNSAGYSCAWENCAGYIVGGYIELGIFLAPAGRGPLPAGGGTNSEHRAHGCLSLAWIRLVHQGVFCGSLYLQLVCRTYLALRQEVRIRITILLLVVCANAVRSCSAETIWRAGSTGCGASGCLPYLPCERGIVQPLRKRR